MNYYDIIRQTPIKQRSFIDQFNLDCHDKAGMWFRIEANLARAIYKFEKDKARRVDFLKILQGRK